MLRKSLLRRFIKHLGKRLNLLSATKRPITNDAFSTHLPILIGLSGLFPIRSVLELGAGDYSTRLFLDREIFPNLQRLETIENDPKWAEDVRNCIGSDPRFCLSEVNGLIAQTFKHQQPDDFDLVFVDDSARIEDRCETIRSLANWLLGQTLAVIHDYEQPAYQVASEGIPHRVMFTALHPSTALLWGDLSIPIDRLQSLDWQLRRHVRDISSSDSAAWKIALSASV